MPVGDRRPRVTPGVRAANHGKCRGGAPREWCEAVRRGGGAPGFGWFDPQSGQLWRYLSTASTRRCCAASD
ncbi:hypothetical protein GCM10010464_33570 [Pseudonocardia yunnanensis]